MLGLAIVLGVAGAIALSDLDRHFPLDLREPPGAFTQWRIRALAASPETCARVLARSGLPVRAAPDRPIANGCGYVDGVAPSAAALALDAPPVMRCPLAAAYLAWERHTLRPAARRLFGVELAGVAHFGAYSCRNVYGRASGRRSQHATANAIDISAFRLADGRTVSVLRDWSDAGPAGRFLREARDGACGVFAGVLSPDYNAAHADHLHLDLGGFDICR
ncbi:extensin family protein [Methylopila turkensis]|uniref:Extensin-like C-terminal domain-containing protein n=1 Tax=Methylopila turkensis TaxID=1437816 RepID=A0A9W6JMU4_9HYPH|nr:extensin family protein [Methylopila turkensis]GLK79296.1 hypothetical protein GCM10008174_10370 [Methylopila turkensis]